MFHSTSAPTTIYWGSPICWLLCWKSLRVIFLPILTTTFYFRNIIKYSTPLPRFWVFSSVRRGTRWDKERQKNMRRIRLDLPNDVTHVASFSFLSSTNDVSNHLPGRKNRQQGGAGGRDRIYLIRSPNGPLFSGHILITLCSVMKLFPQPNRWALLIIFSVFPPSFHWILVKSYANPYCWGHIGLERSDEKNQLSCPWSSFSSLNKRIKPIVQSLKRYAIF